MKDTTGNLFCVFIFLLVSIPVLTRAQDGREGNHCAVAKSPYRLSMDSGKIVCARECISCHLADGMGATGRNSFGNKSSAVKISEVKSLRSQ